MASRSRSIAMFGLLYCTVSTLALFAGPAAVAPTIAQEAGKPSYRLQAGDVLDFGAISVPSLNRRITIGVDGMVAFPLIDEIKVQGMTLSELRLSLQTLLPQRPYRYRGADGRESVSLINPDEIMIDISDYRPVYVGGDVSKPGELKFRAGMTVQQAIVLAGGIELIKGAGASLTTASDLRAEYQSVSSELAKQEARLWRLKSELAGDAQLGDSASEVSLAGYSSPTTEVMGELRKMEVDQFNTRRSDLEKEKEFFVRAATKAEGHIMLLQAQKSQEEEGLKLDEEDLSQIRALHKKGVVPNARLNDARRTALLSSTRLKQTSVQLAQVMREHDAAVRSNQKLEDQRRLQLLSDIQEAQSAIDRLQPRSQAVRQNLLYLTASKANRPGAVGPKKQVVISREDDNGSVQIPAEENTKLLPGDVVQIAVSFDEMLTAPQTVQNVGFNATASVK